MAPKEKEYSFDMRETVIKHYLNGDSERQIATKMLIPRSSINSIITKYKKTKCIGNILGRNRPLCLPACLGLPACHRHRPRFLGLACDRQARPIPLTGQAGQLK